MKKENEFLSIITPTYNESKNINQLVVRIDKAMKGYPYELIVVDDNSPDRTWEIAKKLSEQYPVKVLRRAGKLGLASAVTDGYNIARGNLLCVIDSDLSHPPELIPKMLSAQKKMDADIVVGSRMVPGGGVEGWPNTRKLTSYIATVLAKPVTKVKDPMAGFYMIRRKVIEEVKLKPRGYKILLEILVKGKYTTVVEVPFIFRDRTAGTSKLNMRTNLQYIIQLVGLYRYHFLGF